MSLSNRPHTSDYVGDQVVLARNNSDYCDRDIISSDSFKGGWGLGGTSNWRNMALV